MFEEYYSKQKPGETYYFTATDANHLKQLCGKLAFRLASKKPSVEANEDNMLKSFRGLLDNLPKWHRENLSLVNINSKFNEIVGTVLKQRAEDKTKAKNTNGISY